MARGALGRRRASPTTTCTNSVSRPSVNAKAKAKRRQYKITGQAKPTKCTFDMETE